MGGRFQPPVFSLDPMKHALPLLQSGTYCAVLAVIRFPDAFKIHKEPADGQLRNLRLQKIHGAMQVLPVVFRLPGSVIVKGRKAAVCAAIGV
jgi:hypothetical protein